MIAINERMAKSNEVMTKSLDKSEFERSKNTARKLLTKITMKVITGSRKADELDANCSAPHGRE
jgi:hypothetical protein